ncbi:hypothetical protein PMAYCL1PPCAC_11463, partial [Pristionchus mayeri]
DYNKSELLHFASHLSHATFFHFSISSSFAWHSSLSRSISSESLDTFSESRRMLVERSSIIPLFSSNSLRSFSISFS